jgi:fermentation-respiration switch protein FrsA (DUF1100 family)
MLKLLLVVAAGYGLLVAIAFFAQKSLLYLPNTPGRELTANPAGIGLAYHDVSIKTEDGLTLHGWFIPAASSRVLLFFHGNAGNISHRLASIRQFHSLGLSILIVDYRGYGQNEGKPSEAGLQQDAEAAWRYVTGTRKVAPGDVVIFGRSLGGAVAAWLAARTQPGAFIVESAFTSVPDIAREVYPWLPVRWLSRLQHATLNYVREARCPVLVVHSRDDEIIPYHHGEQIFAAAKEPRALLTIAGGHNDAFVSDEDRYLEGIRGFLSALPSAKSAAPAEHR